MQALHYLEAEQLFTTVSEAQVDCQMQIAKFTGRKVAHQYY